MRLGIGVGIGRQRFAGGFADSYSSRVLADGGIVESLTCVANASTLLQQASLLFIPSGYKAGVAYSALPNNMNGDLTWSRNSTANRTLANGNIGSVGANVPRLSYMYGSCPSALLEPQRTNLILQSEDLSNGWSVEGVAISTNTTNSPDGNLTADTIAETAVTDVHRVYRTAITITSGSNYAFSFYVKKDTQRYVRLVINQSSSTSIWVAVQFDLDTQTFTSGVGSGGGTFVSASITSASNGFYRITLVGSLTTTSAFAFLALSNGNAISSSDSRGCPNYLGNVNNRIWAWGGQFEVGAYATTYIPTTTASATRINDSFSRTNIYTNGLISASGGTWFVELKNNVSYTRDGSMRLGIGDTTSLLTNSLYVIPSSIGRLVIFKTLSGVNTSLFSTTTDNVKIAIKWNGLTADVFVNGVKVVSATTFTTTIMENLLNTASNVPIFIQTMALYNEPKSDQFCIDLTT